MPPVVAIPRTRYRWPIAKARKTGSRDTTLIANMAPQEVVAVASTGASEFPAWLLAGLIAADVLPVVYVLVVAFQRDRRGPHDLAAGTRVVTG